MDQSTFQIGASIFGTLITVVGYLITANVKQFKDDIKKENETQDKRLNSHSSDLKTLNNIVIKNTADLKSNKENDIREMELFKELLHAELKPIRTDLQYLKSKI